MASPLSLPLSIPLPFIFQEAKESIDEEDPRPTSSNGAYIKKGDTKEFWRLVICSFGIWRRETQKEFRRLVLGEFFLAKGEENEKDVSYTNFIRGPLFGGM